MEVGLGLGGAFVDAKVDCRQPFRSGRVGIGPGSPFMNRVYKLELTIKGGKYKNLRLGADLDHSGYTFADIKTHERYPEAWAVEGFLMENKYGAKRRVTIIFKTCSTPRLVSNTKVSRLVIPLRSPTEPHKKQEESFSLRGDQFIDFADDVILVNPIVLGYKKDIGILFDSGSSGILKPRMGFKVKPKST